MLPIRYLINHHCPRTLFVLFQESDEVVLINSTSFFFCCKLLVLFPLFFSFFFSLFLSFSEGRKKIKRFEKNCKLIRFVLWMESVCLSVCSEVGGAQKEKDWVGRGLTMEWNGMETM